MCMSVLPAYEHKHGCKSSEEDLESPAMSYRQLRATVLVLGIEFWSPERATSTLELSLQYTWLRSEERLTYFTGFKQL